MKNKLLLFLLVFFLSVLQLTVATTAPAQALDCTPLDQKVQGSPTTNPLAVIGNIFRNLVSFVSFSAPEIETKYAKIGDANEERPWFARGRRIKIIKEPVKAGSVTYVAKYEDSVNVLVNSFPFSLLVPNNSDLLTSITGWIYGWFADDTSPGDLSKKQLMSRPTIDAHLLGYQNDPETMEELVKLVDETPNWWQTPDAFTMYKKAGVAQRLRLVDGIPDESHPERLRKEQLQSVLSAWSDQILGKKGQAEPRYDSGCGYLQKDGSNTVSVAIPGNGSTSRFLYGMEIQCISDIANDPKISATEKNQICKAFMGNSYRTGEIDPNTFLGNSLGNDPEKLKLTLSYDLAFGKGEKKSAFLKCLAYPVQDAANLVTKEVIRGGNDKPTKTNGEENKNQFKQPISLPAQPAERITREIAEMISPAPVNAKRKEAYAVRPTQCKNASSVYSDTAAAMGSTKFAQTYQAHEHINQPVDPRIQGAFTTGPQVLGIQTGPQVLANSTSLLDFPFKLTKPVTREERFTVEISREHMDLWKNTAGQFGYGAQYLPVPEGVDILKTPVEAGGLSVRELPSGAEMRHGGKEKSEDGSATSAIPTPFGGGITLVVDPCHGLFQQSITPAGQKCNPNETISTGKMLHDLTKDLRHEQTISNHIKQNLASFGKSEGTQDISKN